MLAFEIGEFARVWAEVARRLGLDVEVMPGDWPRGVDPAAVEARLAADRDHAISAVLVVHNETSTGVTSRLPEIRRAIDRAAHPALLLVDAVSSLGSIDLRHDEWGIDVTLAGSQKGLMLPPGLSFNAISEKALAASRHGSSAEVVLVLGADAGGQRDRASFPTRRRRICSSACARRCACCARKGSRTCSRGTAGSRGGARGRRAWGLEIVCEREDEYSPVVTTVMMPTGTTPTVPARSSLDRFNLSLGAGLGRLKGRAFRIGHLGDFNELMLMGTLCGVEMGLALAGVRFQRGGVNAALKQLCQTAETAKVSAR